MILTIVIVHARFPNSSIVTIFFSPSLTVIFFKSDS